MRTILEPVSISGLCSLSEAIYWAGFSFYPVIRIMANGKDYREDMEYIDGYELLLPDEYKYRFSEEITQHYNLPPCMNTMFFHKHGEPHYNPLTKEDIESMYKRQNIDHDTYNDWMDSLHDIEQIQKHQPTFETALDDYLQVHTTELLLHLQKGTVVAYGRKLDTQSFKDIDTYDYPEHEEIDRKYWIRSNVGWDTSTLEKGKDIFIHILIDFDSLIKEFPEPELETIQIYHKNGMLILDDETPKNRSARPKGRPSYKWKEFNAEMAHRLTKGELPPLQKACVIDMQEWCVKEWGASPSESNLKEHISPFYRGMLKSENS